MNKIALLLIFLLCCAPQLYPISKQDKVKGLLIERISSFITWPTASSEHFNIAVYNDETLARGYQELYKEHKKVNAPIMIIPLSNGLQKNDLNDVAIIYIKHATEKNLAKLLKTTSGQPILTISDQSDFINKGVMINLVSDDGKIKFVIDHSALHSANLKASYRLLKLSKIINPVRQP